jgi:hypothetical protein
MDEIFTEPPTLDEARAVAARLLERRGWTHNETTAEWCNDELDERGLLCFFPVDSRVDPDRIREVKLQLHREDPRSGIRFVSVVTFPQEEWEE